MYKTPITRNTATRSLITVTVKQGALAMPLARDVIGDVVEPESSMSNRFVRSGEMTKENKAYVQDVEKKKPTCPCVNFVEKICTMIRVPKHACV